MSVSILVLTAAAMVQHGAHVHGQANLAVAVQEDGTAFVEYTSPASDVYGFEHAPETAEQEASIASMNAQIAAAGAIVTLDGGNCILSAPEISWGSGHEDHDDHHDHDDHGHDHHGDHDHDDHDHGHDDHAGAGDYGDVMITWNGQCENPSRVQGVSTTAFNLFPSITDIDGVYLGPNQQTGFELSQGTPAARLR